METTEASTATNYEENDNIALTDEWTSDFYIPDCAALTSVKIKDNSVEARLQAPGNWKALYDSYEEFSEIR